MNGSHVAGAGFGAILGTVLVALGTRIGLDLTNVDSAALGMGCVGAFLGIGHAVGEEGVAGIVRTLWRGHPKPAPASTNAAPVASTTGTQVQP